MKGLLAAALLLIGFGSNAGAQQAFGPIDITNDVNGIPVTVSATSWLTIQSADDDARVDVRILADLIDLQRKFPDVVATFTPPADVCVNRRGGHISPVTALNRASLVARDNQLIITMRGHIAVWSCRLGDRKFALRWRKKKIASIGVKLPVIRSWRHMAKKKEGSQQFRGNLPIYLVQEHNAAVSLKTAAPELKLVGHDTVVNEASLRTAEARIRQTAYAALQRAIDPAKLTDALPAKLRHLKLTVVSARFRALGGHAMAEINLAGHVPDGLGTTLMQEMAARSAE